MKKSFAMAETRRNKIKKDKKRDSFSRTTKKEAGLLVPAFLFLQEKIMQLVYKNNRLFVARMFFVAQK